MPSLSSKKKSLGLRLLQQAIRFYQATLSPDHGPLARLFPYGVCRFRPTCSEYASQALELHGWRGVFLALKRIARCHPLAAGGYDPVPHRSEALLKS